MRTYAVHGWGKWGGSGLAAALLVSGAASAQSAGTAFTYQGQLVRDGMPVNGSCDCRFGLWDDELAGGQVGGELVFEGGSSIPMSDGLFTAILDFGPAVFDGDARWLEVEVKCAGDPGYTTLSPRQPLTPAPYALALPGVRTEAMPNCPNIVAGWTGNGVLENPSDPYEGVTIGGGGIAVDPDSVPPGLPAPNLAGGDFVVICGGSGNSANGSYATVGGGKDNDADGNYSTIGGGQDNYINSDGAWGTIAGGGHNRVYVSSGAVVGGQYNEVQSDAIYSTALGGWSNEVHGDVSMVFGYGVTAGYDYTVSLYNNDHPGSLVINREQSPQGHPIIVGDASAGHGNGAHLTSSGTWENASSRSFKEGFRPVDGEDLLRRIRDLPIESWVYKGKDERHIGPCAEDFHRVFADGDDPTAAGTRDTRYLAALDVAGVSLAAVKVLDAVVAKQETRIATLEAQVAELERMLGDDPGTAAHEPASQGAAVAGGALILAGLAGLALHGSLRRGGCTMRRAHVLILTAAAALPLAAATVASGDYVLARSTVDGGGVTFATAGVYDLAATVGQPDAAPAEGGTYLLAGGFWAVPPRPPCVGDLNGDGDVGFGDLLMILGQWGPCSGCPEDLDGNGDVGFSDLLILLGGWGPCP